MRLYAVERYLHDEADGIFVTGEAIAYEEPDGRWQVAPSMGDCEGYLTQEELIALQGGAEALMRWGDRHDAPYQVFSDREEEHPREADEREEAAFANVAPMARRFGRG
jgi:hypothetical protein